MLFELSLGPPPPLSSTPPFLLLLPTFPLPFRLRFELGTKAGEVGRRPEVTSCHALEFLPCLQ